MKRITCLTAALLLFLFSVILFAETVPLQAAQTESDSQYTDKATGLTLSIPGVWKKVGESSLPSKTNVLWAKSGFGTVPYLLLQSDTLPSGMLNARDFAIALMTTYRDKDNATAVELPHELIINGISVQRMVIDLSKPAGHPPVARTAIFVFAVGNRAVRIIIADDADKFAETETKIAIILDSFKITAKGI